LDRKTGKFNLIHYCDISTPAKQQHFLFSGWHHRVNGKAGGNSLGFYRLVPLLLREADLVTIAVETRDLSRYSSPHSIQQQAALETLAEICGWVEDVKIPGARRRSVCHSAVIVLFLKCIETIYVNAIVKFFVTCILLLIFYLI